MGAEALGGLSSRLTPLASVSVDGRERLGSDCRKDPLSEDPLSPGSGKRFKKRREDESLHLVH